MTEKTYNGWSNYETWNVKLWIDNDEGSYNHWRDTTRDVMDRCDFGGVDFDEDRAITMLADLLKNQIADGGPDLGVSCYADLLNAALGEVDWHEIATSMVEDIKQEA